MTQYFISTMSSSSSNNNNDSTANHQPPSPSAAMAPSNGNANESPSPGVQVMLRCGACGHLVPEQNMELHRYRVCQGTARHSRPHASLPAAPTHHQQQQQQHLPQHQHLPQNQPARPIGSIHADLFGATAPVEQPGEDEWAQSRRLGNRNRAGGPEAVALPVHLTGDSTATATAPMEWNQSSDDQETFLATGQAVSRVPHDETKRAARRDSTGSSGGNSVLQVGDVGDVIDLVDNTSSPGENNGIGNDTRYGMTAASGQEQWPCPRCTLHNPGTTSFCEACNYSRQDATVANSSTSSADGIRAADPVRRERLIPDPFAEVYPDAFLGNANVRSRVTAAPTHTFQQQEQQQQQRQEQQDEQQQPSFMSGGALLGGVLGAAGAYLQGRPVGSAALRGVVNGAISGAVLQEVMQPRNPPAGNRSSRNRNIPTVAAIDVDDDAVASHIASHTAAVRASHAAAVHTSHASHAAAAHASHAAAHAAAPVPVFSPQGGSQRVHVVRSRGRNGRLTTTVYSSSPMGPGGPMPVAAGEDPMMAYIMQSMVNSPGGMGMLGGGANMNLDGMSYEQLLQRFGDGSENMGAEERDIRSLPSAVVHNPDKLPEDCRECAICLETFEAGIMRKTLPCLHGFHQACVDKWLRTNAVCPICKHRIDG